MGNINVIQPPVLTGQNFEQASAQLYSYLFRVSEQLNIVLNDLSEDQFTENVRRSLVSSGRSTTDKEIKDTYAQLRSLIITTADVIEQEMQVLQISLEGSYTALSAEFGSYTEKTTNTLKATSDNITAIFTNLTSIESSVAGFESYMSETMNWIRAGLLDNTQTPALYGVEIGQTDSADETPYLVRITSKRISFYQGETEACYISNGRWGAPGIDISGGGDIRFSDPGEDEVWQTGVDSSGWFYLRYMGD